MHRLNLANTCNESSFAFRDHSSTRHCSACSNYSINFHKMDTATIPIADESKSDDIQATVARLSTPDGSQVYIIGTAHFSLQSVKDVQAVIRETQPNAVILELCDERAALLTLDEASLLEQNRSLSLDSIRSAIRQRGLANGLLFTLLIKMSADLTENLGLAPGSEFRAAWNEARHIPGCAVVFGDRLLSVTLSRAVNSISIWQTIKLAYNILTHDVSITQEDVESWKNKDMLQQLLDELGCEFPGFKKTLLDERNIYLAHNIYKFTQNFEPHKGPKRVVAVVGIGHVSGIVDNWAKTTDEQCQEVSVKPMPSLTRRVIKKTIKYGSLALLVYIGYRVFKPPISSLQKAIQSKISQ